MYNTGDRCRWLDNGTIEPLGRMDDQIKIKVLLILFITYFANTMIGVQDRTRKYHNCYRGKSFSL